jgi:2-phosphosulfolactate phosphatase
MTIKIIKNVEEANQATGLTIIIDVFRAFTTECFVLQNEAKYIIPVLTLEEAFTLKEQNPEYVLMGERGGVKPEGFDFGNSPTEILNVDFTDKIVVHTTSNGTKGMMNAINAGEIITGSFVNAQAIIEHIKSKGAQEISLVSTSTRWDEDNEDILLAYYVRDILQGEMPDVDKIKERLRNSSVASFLLQEAGVPSTDIDLCLDFNRFDFIIEQVEINGRRVLVKKNI